jgi:CPA1 family monovalent cation:H+ antiporter
MFRYQWLAMLIGIGAVLITRALLVYALLPPVKWIPGVSQISLAHRTALFWGGLRGAATLALALSLPLELDAWWTVQSMAYGVVLFALFVQAPSLGLLLKRLPLVETANRAP